MQGWRGWRQSSIIASMRSMSSETPPSPHLPAWKHNLRQAKRALCVFETVDTQVTETSPNYDTELKVNTARTTAAGPYPNLPPVVSYLPYRLGEVSDRLPTSRPCDVLPSRWASPPFRSNMTVCAGVSIIAVEPRIRANCSSPIVLVETIKNITKGDVSRPESAIRPLYPPTLAIDICLPHPLVESPGARRDIQKDCR